MGYEVNFINELIKSHYEYLSKCEKDSTLIEKEITTLKIQTHQLEAQRDILSKYYDNHFQEQRIMYNKANKLLDYAISRGNSDISKMALKIIEIVHNKTVF